MDTFPDRPLSDADIIRLGVEAGAAVLAMPEFPTPFDREEALSRLSMRVIELTNAQQVQPEGGRDA